MGLNPQLVALTYPDGTEFPGTPQALLDLQAQYYAITGLENFNGINFGAVEPSPDNRDKPWFKTDNSGNPIGWYSWNGAAWTPVPLVTPNGASGSRPVSAALGQLFLDTTIDVMLRWNGSTWITDSGSPGDVKAVKAATLAEALAKNPGWVQDTDSIGRVIAGADASGPITYGETLGETEHTILLAELPNDAVRLLSGWGIFPGQHQNGHQNPGVFPITTGLGDPATQTTGPINPNTQTAIPLYQPTIGYWMLTKS